MGVMAIQSGKQGRSVLELIGNTPMLRFNRVGADLSGVELLAKAEWYNPGGSVKDRAAMNMANVGDRATIGISSENSAMLIASSVRRP